MEATRTGSGRAAFVEEPEPAVAYDASMGKLIDRERRDRARADRSNRQAAILEKARSALLSQQPGELSLEALDRAAGLRQGAASMYFGSLEGVVFRLLREEISSWLDRLEALLQESSGALSLTELVGVLATSLLERPLLSRLLAALPSMAGRRTAEMDQLLDLETWRLERLRESGALVAGRCPALSPGGATVILRRALLLAAALEPLLNPPSGLVLAMNDPALAPLYPDAGEELRTLLAMILESACRGGWA